MSQKKIATIPVPLAKTIDTFMTIHGDTRKDPYYWLNNRENPEVVNYLNEENSYLDAGMLHTKQADRYVCPIFLQWILVYFKI